MAKNHCLAKSINDASWYQFRIWIEYFGKVFEKVTVAVNPHYTSSECYSCGAIVKKTLSTRTHVCRCGCSLDRDFNAARNILSRGLSTVGHTETFALNASNALGESTSTMGKRNPVLASWLVDRRIPTPEGPGVSIMSVYLFAIVYLCSLLDALLPDGDGLKRDRKNGNDGR